VGFVGQRGGWRASKKKKKKKKVRGWIALLQHTQACSLSLSPGLPEEEKKGWTGLCQAGFFFCVL
jgi:hypothetical protein